MTLWSVSASSLKFRPSLVQNFFMGVDVVDADPQNDRFPLGILRLIHLEIVRLARAARRLVFRIEVKDDPLFLGSLSDYPASLPGKAA